jgi:hypothetical protein
MQEMYPFDWSVVMEQFVDETHIGRYTDNKCKDRALSKCEGADGDPTKCDYLKLHNQSPIQVQFDPNAPICDDRHAFQTPVDGTCQEDEMLFRVTPTGLRADLECSERPQLDFSRNRYSFDMRAIEVKVPAEHEHRLPNGDVLTYDAEFQLMHTATGGLAGNFGAVAIWLQASGDVKNAEIEKYLLKWEEALEHQYEKCDVTYDEDSCDIQDDYEYILPKDIDEWERISFDTFEKGTDKKWAGGNNTAISNSPGRTKSGVRAFRMRSNGSESAIYTKELYDVRKFAEVNISFYVFGQSVRSGERLELGYSSDGCVSFERIGKWVVGDDLVKDDLEKFSVLLKPSDVDFTNQVQLGFKAYIGDSGRSFYIDDIDILGRIDLDDLIEAQQKAIDTCTVSQVECCSDNREGWVTLSKDDFGTSFGNFGPGDPNVSGARWGSYSDGVCYISDNADGTYCVRMRKGRKNPLGSSFAHVQDYDITPYSEVKVSFWVYLKNMDERDGDSFALDYSSDSGDTWTQVRSWVVGTDIQNDEPRAVTFLLTSQDVPFTDEARVRFRADATAKSDQIYIDNVEFSGWAGTTEEKGVCTPKVVTRCCGRRLRDNNGAEMDKPSLLRGGGPKGVPADAQNPESDAGPTPPRRELKLGEFSCDQNDFYCPYRLFRETNNPVRILPYNAAVCGWKRTATRTALSHTCFLTICSTTIATMGVSPRHLARKG